MSNQLAAITFDCLDVTTMSSFWSAVTEVPIDPDANEFVATLGANSGTTAWFFLQVGERSMEKNPIHVDLVAADDFATEIERLQGLGAERVGDFAEHGFTWVTFRDPEGNFFDLAASH